MCSIANERQNVEQHFQDIIDAFFSSFWNYILKDILYFPNTFENYKYSC